MNERQFCFISDQYYIDFPDDQLMKNKEKIDSKFVDSPCFFAFRDVKDKDIIWLIPISSRHEKYKKIYDKNIAKYGQCTTIRFWQVLGREAAFLIQNMCPATEKYIREVYVDKYNSPINIGNRIIQDVVTNAKAVISKVNRGKKLIFPDVLSIKNALLADLNKIRTIQLALDDGERI